MNNCSIEGCGLPVKAGGLCNKHYTAASRASKKNTRVLGNFEVGSDNEDDYVEAIRTLFKGHVGYQEEYARLDAMGSKSWNAVWMALQEQLWPVINKMEEETLKELSERVSARKLAEANSVA